MKYLVACLFVIWISAGLYFGVGGIAQMKINAVTKEKNQLDAQATDTGKNSAVLYDGIPFKDINAVKQYLDEQKIEQLKKIVPFFDGVPDYLALIITGSSFSLLGVLIRMLIGIILNKRKLIEMNYLSEPLLGILTGIVVQGAASLVPIVFTGKAIEINTVSLVFFCLFAGLYYDSFYEKIQDYFKNKIFSK